MVDLLLAWLVMSLIIMLTAALVPGVEVKSFGSALWASLLLGVLNALAGWVLFILIGIGTMGLGFILAFVTHWFVLAILLKGVASLSKGLEIESFGRAFLAAMVMSGLSTLAEIFLLG